jgi:NAD(P)-dependent dehydrogenase (short-subunit alcohol dehydrogenase family)
MSSGWDIQGLSVLVTGAEHGIGKAIADAFEAAGALVHAADVAWPGGMPPETELRRPCSLDVRDVGAVHSAIEEIASSVGLDVLVNNAGVMRARSLLEVNEDDWEAMISVNARGTFFCLQAAARAMMTEGRGSIVNIASVAGLDGRTYSPVYAASKAAVINMTRSAARELARVGVRVNAVCPGVIDTEFNDRLEAEIGMSPGELLPLRVKNVPLGRVGTADDVARIALFLASPHSSYVTGQAFNVDGGLVMS